MKSLPQIIRPHLKRVLNYGRKLGVSFFVWNSSSNRVTMQRGQTFRFIQIAIIFVLIKIISQVCSVLFASSASVMDRFQGGFFCFVYSTLFLIRERTPSPETVQLLNLMCHEGEQDGKINEVKKLE